MRHESLRLAVAAAVLGTAPSFAATTYRVTFNGNDVFQSTPVSRAESNPLPPSRRAQQSNPLHR